MVGDERERPILRKEGRGVRRGKERKSRGGEVPRGILRVVGCGCDGGVGRVRVGTVRALRECQVRGGQMRVRRDVVLGESMGEKM